MKTPRVDRRRFLGTLAAAPLLPGRTPGGDPAGSARFAIDLATLIDRHDMIWRDYLPGDWMEGAPLGNGEIGALVHGSPDELSIVLAKSDVWDRQNDDGSTFPGEDFAAWRRTYLDGDWPGYLRLQREAAVRRRRQTLALPHLTSCGRLTLHVDGGLKKPGCRMRVGLRDGEALLEYLDRKIRIFASRRYRVLVIDIDRGAPEVDPPDPVEANRYGTHPPLEELPWSLWRPRLDGNPGVECTVDGSRAFLTQRFAAGGGYTIGVALGGFDQAEARPLGSRLLGHASAPRARRCQLLATIVSADEAADPVAECRGRLEAALRAGSDAILAAHRDWWRDYWMRGLATVGDAAVEKWYYCSLYLCGSMFEPGRQSPGLQGLWCGENFPRWCADFHSNGNIQALYWGLFANNRLPWTEPYFAYYRRIAPVARRVARDYYRMRGLRFPHMGSIGGHELNPPNMLMTDPGGTPWIAQLFWQYYEYSQDRAWLETEGYPILRDAALFCADYLTRDERGRWTIAPALHFEVRTYSADARPPKPPPFEMWGTNSLYGQAMFRMAFTQAIRAARELGVDERLCREWQEKLDGLAPPPSSPAGYWKAWENREPVYGWHNFLLPLAFPAELVSRFHGPPEWLERSRATWRHLRDHDLAANTGKAWVGGQGICELHRIGAVEEAFRGARWPARRPREGRRAGIPVPAGMLVRADEQQENGLSANPAAPVLQADHGAGMCRVLADMLVLGVDGTIHVFSGIPADVPARFFSLRAPGGFLLSGEKRGAKPDYVLVTPTAARPFRLGNVWGGAVAVTDLASGRLLRTTAEPVVAADLAVGREYLVASSGFRMEDLPRQDFAL